MIHEENNFKRPSGEGRLSVSRVLPAAGAVAVALTLFASTGGGAQRVGGATSRLVLEKPRYDFGQVFAGEDLSHVFWVRNTGTAPLELSETPLTGARPSKVSLRLASKELDPLLARGVGSRAAPS